MTEPISREALSPVSGLRGSRTFNAPRDLQTPKHRTGSRYTGLYNAGSPGDGEAPHDIIWDPMSPTEAKTGNLQRVTRVVEISDIVNRIASEDAAPVVRDSRLLQWFGDSAVPCTPEVTKPRARRKSTKQSNAEGLVELARQFDKTMQEDSKAAEQLSRPAGRGNPSQPKPRVETLPPGGGEDPRRHTPSESQKAEEELHALFDCSTQGVRGRLSQGLSASGCSQEPKGRPARPATARQAKEAGPSGVGAGRRNDFEDDWENDDLLSDSLLLELTQDSEQSAFTKMTSTTSQFPRDGKPDGKPVGSVSLQGSLQAPPGTLQELCPKPKTAKRSTFTLEPNPDFQARVAATNPSSKASATVVELFKLQKHGERSASFTPATKLDQPAAADSKTEPKEINMADKDGKSTDRDCSWDEGDDELLFQVCDNVERLSNSQPPLSSPPNPPPGTARRNTTAPVAIGRGANANASRSLACSYVRSNSVPGASRDATGRRGWSVAPKGAVTDQSPLSQSHPGGHVGRGTFGHLGKFPGTARADQDAKPTVRPPIVTAGAASQHSTFKRNRSDSAVIGSKVFGGGHVKRKCSTAEIESKKQDALARRRLRMENSQKL